MFQKHIFVFIRRKFDIRDNPRLRAAIFVSISVRQTHPLYMQVLQSSGDGVENGARLSLREKLLSEDFVQQLASFHQLRHQEHRPTVVIHLRYKNKTTHTYVRNYLATESLSVSSLIQISRFVDYFHHLSRQTIHPPNRKKNTSC